MVKYYEMIAIRNFFRNGKLILKGEIIDCDEEAKNQMLEEELMEYTRVQNKIEETNSAPLNSCSDEDFVKEKDNIHIENKRILDRDYEQHRDSCECYQCMQKFAKQQKPFILDGGKVTNG